MIFASIRHALANLLRFSGRDSRAIFWPYAAVVTLFDLAAALALIVWILAPLQRFLSGHPKEGSIESGPGYFVVNIQADHPELMPNMSLVSTCYAVIVAASILLLAAAVTRRLHDRRSSGWWGLLPLPFVESGLLVNFVGGIDSHEPLGMKLFALLRLNNGLFLLSLLFLAILLAGAGTGGPNQFGEPAA